MALRLSKNGPTGPGGLDSAISNPVTSFHDLVTVTDAQRPSAHDGWQ